MPVILPPPGTMTAPFRLGYTVYKRHKAPHFLPFAMNAAPFEVVFSENLEALKEHEGREHKLPSCTDNELELTDSDITNERISISPAATRLIAIYPQYLARTQTTITIREVDFPKRSSSFMVYTHTDSPNNTTSVPTTVKKFEDKSLGEDKSEDSAIFQVHRERPSLTHRQTITDVQTNTLMITVRKDLGPLPHSYRFDDPSETKILDLQGNFSMPTQGLRAHALFTNNTGQDHGNVKLFMQASWRNRHAVIRDVETKEVLAVMRSDIFNVRSLTAGRRKHTVTVSAGVDLLVVTGMIVALDERA